DTTGPSAPSVSLSAATGNTFVSGSTVYIFFQSSKPHTFLACDSSSDICSSNLKLNFPTLTGFTSGGGDITSSPFQTTYNWTGAVGASGSQTITSDRKSTRLNSSHSQISYAVFCSKKNTLTVNGTAATGGGSASYPSSGSFTIS